LCELNVENKFQAETLVIYPDYCYDTPIFGTEYLKIGNKKYFGAIDFHPVNENENYFPYIEMFPDAKTNTSKFYNLNQYFSNKLWIRKGNECFYNEYQIMLKCYLHQYKKCLFNSNIKKESFQDEHNNFNRYMSSNDPAFGILKSYFSKDFTEKYIQEFLFTS
jgi:15,16-dihydrobiliverdin:ferredoxin oxidoreductase